MAEKKSGWDAWNKKKMKKALKKLHRGYIMVIVISLLLGAVGGAAYAYTVTARDEFVLCGNKETEISVGTKLTYEDEGIKCISMGKDVSDKVEIKTNMDRSEDGKTFTATTFAAGEYYISYTVTEGRYAGLSRVRVFKVTYPKQGNE